MFLYLVGKRSTDLTRRRAYDCSKKSISSALPAYTQLSSLVAGLKDAQTAAEGGAPHLVDHVERQAGNVYAQLRDAACHELNLTLEKMGWPGKDLHIDDGTAARWTEQVNALLSLQEPDLKSRFLKAQKGNSPVEPVILIPFEVMVRPLQLRFRYHFMVIDPPTDWINQNIFSLIFLTCLRITTTSCKTICNRYWTKELARYLTWMMPSIQMQCLLSYVLCFLW